MSIVVDLDDLHSVGEGRDVQHVEENSLGRSDLGSGLNEMNVGNNFNCSTGNLGGDVKSLEERGLSGFHTSVSTGYPNIVRSPSSSLGGGSDLVGEDDIPDLLEGRAGEDESYVSLDVGKEPLELGVLREDKTDGPSDHGVLSHENLSFASEGLTDLVHLVGSNIVDVDDEDGGCRKIQAAG